jgi:hypothetical protein
MIMIMIAHIYIPNKTGYIQFTPLGDIRLGKWVIVSDLGKPCIHVSVILRTSNWEIVSSPSRAPRKDT